MLRDVFMGGVGATAPFGLTVIIWITFAVFVSFVSRLNLKINVPRLLVS